MKRLISLILCLMLIFPTFGSAVFFADDTAGETGGDQASYTSDLPTYEEPEPEEDPVIEDLTPEDKAELLNKAELNPMITNCEPLDTLAAQVLSEIITPEMTTFEKVCAIFIYLMDGSEYVLENKTADEFSQQISRTHFYKSRQDFSVVCDAYGMLVEHKGKCKHYSSAFVVMTRAIGLESYPAVCCSAGTGLGSHESAMIMLDGNLYHFDPVMDFVTDNTDAIASSSNFCTFMDDIGYGEYSCLEEQLDYFKNFELGNERVAFYKNSVQGATNGDVRFTFGSYPQTKVTDSDLIDALNEQLDGVAMNIYPYSYGDGEIGSQTKGGFMSWADVITYENEKYRAVRIDDYRSNFIYKDQTPKDSAQYKNGYRSGNTYWFKYEPIEWRLTDGESLLVADLVLDSQPFNDEMYTLPGGKVINGKKYYVFKDAEFTVPANDWEYSYIRSWLNDEFYNTAFTPEEQELIIDTQLATNYGVFNYFDYASTTDKVFLLSNDEVSYSGYFMAENNSTRQTSCSDYAVSQGANSARREDGYGYSTAYILRTPGYHSEDVAAVNNRGAVHSNISVGCTVSGIRPAIRVVPIEDLIPETLAAPARVIATPTDTGQITLSAAVSNGAEHYKFYCYSGSSTAPYRILTSNSPVLAIDGFEPGQTYRFRASAVRVVDNQYEETPLTGEVSAVCRTFVEPPETMTAEAVATGKIKLSWEAVEGAIAYDIYRYMDSDNMDLCARVSDTSIVIDGLSVGSHYLFKISSVSDDGYESLESENIASCMCLSFPERPMNVEARPVSTGEIEVTWDEVEGAGYYNVYRYKNSVLTYIGTTRENCFTEKGLSIGSTYSFKVEAVSPDGSDISSLSNTARASCESIPPIPGNLTDVSRKTGIAELCWDAVEGADLYHIYQYNRTEKEYFELGTSVEPHYTVEGLTPEYDYTFRVIAEKTEGSHLSAPASLKITAQSVPPCPKGLAAESPKTGCITLTWEPVEGAGSYNIYRYFSLARQDLIGVAEETSFVVENLTSGTSYSFKVQAVSEDGEDLSGFSAKVTAPCLSIPEKPSGLSCETLATGVLKVSWDAVEDAASYNVYRYLNLVDRVFVGSVEDTFIIEEDLKADTVHTYKVEAVSADGEDISALSDSFKAYCASIPPIPEQFAADPVKTGEIRLTWNASEGAALYRIYQYNSETGLYDEIGSTDGLEYTVSGLNGYQSYTFRITAETEDGASVSSPVKLSVVAPSIPERPDNVVLEPVATGKIKVSWDAVEGASSYNVYRYYSSVRQDLMGVTEETSFVVEDLTPGSLCFFRVEAVSPDGEDISSPSRTVNGPCLSIPERPLNAEAEAIATGVIRVTWDAVEDAATYNVYSYLNAVDRELIGTVEETEFIIRDLTPGKTYSFKIEAVSEDGSDVSALSATASTKCMSVPPTPEQFTSDPVKTGEIRLTWNASEGAALYRIYQYNSETGLYDEIGSTDGLGYTVSGLNGYQSYTFRITAETEDGASVSSPVKLSVVAPSIPERPENVVLEPVATGKIKVSWDAVDGASSYNVYRYFSTARQDLMGVTEETSFVVEDLTPGTSYTFKVQAVSGDGEDLSVLSAKVSAMCLSIPEKPLNAKAEAVATGVIRVTWDAVEDAARYNVYNYFNTVDRELIGTVEEPEFLVNNLTPGKTYSFKIEAVSEDGSDVSVLSATVSAKCMSVPSAPDGLIATSANRPYTVSLSWAPVEEATGYEVYRYFGAETGFVAVGRTAETWFEVTGLKNGSQHVFRVAALKEEGDYTHISVQSLSAYGYSNAISAPGNITVTATESCEITVGWDPVYDADRYDVFCYDKTDKVYVQVGSTDETSFAVKGLTGNTTYTFCVRAVSVFGDTEFSSDKSSQVSCKALKGPDAPTGLIADIGTSSISLRWNAVNGAVGYRVMSGSDSPDSEDTVIGETENTSIVLEQFDYNTLYRIYVVAVGQSGEYSLTGSPSVGIAILIPPISLYILGDANSDGSVDMVDATIIQRVATMLKVPFTEEQLMAADIDGDGSLTTVDATFIQRYSTNIATPYDIGLPVYA